MERFSSFLVIHNNLSIKNLDKIIAIKFSIKIRSRIYENIQLNVVNERCVMELLMVIRNNQWIAGVLESNNRRLKSGALRAALEKARREEESKC